MPHEMTPGGWTWKPGQNPHGLSESALQQALRDRARYAQEMQGAGEEPIEGYGIDEIIPDPRDIINFVGGMGTTFLARALMKRIKERRAIERILRDSAERQKRIDDAMRKYSGADVNYPEDEWQQGWGINLGLDDPVEMAVKPSPLVEIPKPPRANEPITGADTPAAKRRAAMKELKK